MRAVFPIAIIIIDIGGQFFTLLGKLMGNIQLCIITVECIASLGCTITIALQLFAAIEVFLVLCFIITEAAGSNILC